MKKIYLGADQLLNDSFILAEKILTSKFIPDLVVGIWRGGSPVAIAIVEVFGYAGIEVEHLPLKAASYSGIAQRSGVKLTGLDMITDSLDKHGKLLLVDDVFDTGNSIQTIMDALTQHYGQHMPQIRVAVPWFKPDNNQTSIKPDYFLHETTDWLVFPHELAGLGTDDLLSSKPLQKGVLERIIKSSKTTS